ncbi:MAG: GEVED domain-containing protein [Planctomycetota bacterium]|nr:GEVED domain-containing protein [Planctomycetota bacterium]
MAGSFASVSGQEGITWSTAVSADRVTATVTDVNLGTISGTAFDDINANGQRDAGEPGLANVTINVDLDNDGDGDGNMLTEADGSYEFQNNVPVGTHAVSAAAAGLIPTSLAAVLNVTAMSSFSGIDFGFFQPAMATGRSFDDQNGDGDDESGSDPGLGNLTVDLFRDADGNGAFDEAQDELLRTATTAAGDGGWSINGIGPGVHFLRQRAVGGATLTSPTGGVHVVDPTSGQQITGVDFGNFSDLAISGNVFDDVNANGVRENGDVGLEDRLIDLYRDDGDGAFDPNLDQLVDTEGTTEAHYLFEELGPGIYFVLRGQLAPGTTGTLPAAGLYTVVAESGVDVTSLDFGNFTHFGIDGTVFDDLLGNGQEDNEDELLGGITVELFRDDGDGNFDADADDMLGVTTTSVLSGSYIFEDLGPGIYFVRSPVPQGTIVAGPPGGVQTIVAESGVNVPQRDFFRFTNIEISGRAFDDLNGDGNDDNDSDPGRGSVTIDLFRDDDGNGQTTQSELVTSAIAAASSGTYSFTDVGPGDYFVRVQPPSGTTTTAPAFGEFFDSAISGRNLSDLNFGFFTLVSLRGNVFRDANENGVRDADETAGIEGSTVYADADDDGVLDLDETSTLSDANGDYTLAGFAAGTHRIRQIPPRGLAQTAPADEHAVTVTSGVDISALDFGNRIDPVVDLPAGGGVYELLIDAGDILVRRVNGTNDFTELFRLPAPSVDSLVINGTLNVEIVRVLFANGNPIPVDGVFVTGGGDADRLELNGGSFDTVTGTSTGTADTVAGIIALDPDGPGGTAPSAISWSGVPSITDDSTVGHRVFQLRPADSVTTIDDPGIAGQSQIASQRFGTVRFSNPSSSLEVRNGSPVVGPGPGGIPINDLIDVRGLGSGFAADLIIDGEGGTDSIRFFDNATNTGGGSITIIGDVFQAPVPVNTAGGDVSITTDVLQFNQLGNFPTLSQLGGIDAGSGNIYVQPVLPDTPIGLGNGSGTLQLDQDVLTRLHSEGLVTIGRSDSTALTDIDAVNLSGESFDLSVISGSINVSRLDVGLGNELTLTARTGAITTDPFVATNPNSVHLIGNTVTLNGVVAPGASPGLFGIQSDLILGSDDTLQIEINGTQPFVEYDRLLVYQDMTLAGATLDVAVGGNLSVGDRFHIVVKCESIVDYTGRFAGLPEGGTFRVGNTNFRITYQGDEGSCDERDNDITLEVVLPDEDVDGVGDAIENAAPNGGDGNNDGTPDSQQANVASLPNAVTDDYITLAAPAGVVLSGVRSEPAGVFQAGLEFPIGLLAFSTSGISVGGSTTVTINIPDNVQVNSYYKFGSEPVDDPQTLQDETTTPHLYPFLFDGTTGAELVDADSDGDVDLIRLHLVDGGRGDHDLTANGVIEDPGAPGLVTIDFGDAPAPYPTLLADNGARHLKAGLMLGGRRDSESDGRPTAAANGDDRSGDDDEDGVTFGMVRVGQLDATVTVNVQGIPDVGGNPGTARLDAWIDFNGDGSWSGPFERIADSVAVVNGDNTITFDVPSWAHSGTTFARFRLSTAGGLGVRGSAADGEVEDHAVTLIPPTFTDGDFGPANTISTNAGRARSVFAADIDGDGDMDVLSASFDDDKIAWYENVGSGSFTPHIISTSADGAQSVFAADVDGDGDLDVLSASSQDDKIAWYENDGTPADGGWTARTINTPDPDGTGPLQGDADGATSVFAADIDGDGDIDVIFASCNDDRIAWYENDGTPADGGWTARNVNMDPDGRGGPQQGDADGAFDVFVADVDGDGDSDLLSASLFDDKIAWFENVGFDFGDAPAPYPTLLANDGARHLGTGLTLGASRDSEPDGQPIAAADGDDTGGDDDEDGVTFTSPIQRHPFAPFPATVTVNVQNDGSNGGVLNAWIDFNQDGDWLDAGEQIFTDKAVISGDNALTFNVPVGVPLGGTFARFRLSTGNGLSPTGEAADGEVEDYPVTVTRFRELPLAVLDGSTGFRLDGAAQNDGSGRAVSSAGDVNGDGVDDLIIGAYAASPNGSNSGSSYVVFGKSGGGFAASINLSSLDGSTGFRLDGVAQFDNSGIAVSSAGDVNGDGFDDLIIGAHRADPNGDRSGLSYVMFGGNFTGGAETQVGDGNANMLTANQGAAAVDILIGGGNDDVLIGDGGADVLRGGEGDDLLAVPALNFQRIDGGSGIDTLRLDASGLTFDLTAIPDNRLTGIELIDIRGSGPNTLKLTRLEVLNLSDSSNTLVVTGDSDDLIEIGEFNRPDTIRSTEVIDGGLYRVYSSGTATLKVASAIQPLVTLPAGGGSYELLRAGGDAVLRRVGGQGEELFHDATASFRSLVIDGSSGDDLLTVDFSQGDPVPLDGVTFNGGGQSAGGDSLEFRGRLPSGKFQTVVYAATGTGSGRVEFDFNSTVQFTGLEPIVDDTLAAHRVFAIDAAFVGDPQISVGDDPSAIGRSLIQSAGGPGFESVSFVSPTVSLSIAGAGGNDTVTVSPLDVTFSAALSISGGGGNDTIDATAAEIPVTIDGGEGNDVLRGGKERDVLQGGSGMDQLEVAGVAAASIAGGDGPDTLRVIGTGTSLDLTALPDGWTSGIETIDLTAAGANLLKLDLLSVLNASDTTNTLTVRATTEDTTTIGRGWNFAGQQTVDGQIFKQFTRSGATLLVSGESTVAEFLIFVAPDNDATNDIVLVRDRTELVITNDGIQVARQPLADGMTVIIRGADGAVDDTLTVDYSGGNPAPDEGIQYEGGAGGDDALVIQGGTAGVVTHEFRNANDGSVTIDGDTIFYTGLEPIIDRIQALERFFTFLGTNNEITLGDDDASGNNSSRISSVSSSEQVDFVNPSRSLVLNAGAGDDKVLLLALDAEPVGGVFPFEVLVNGQGGNNDLDASGFPAPLSLIGTAGDDVLSISNTNFRRIDGAAGRDTLKILGARVTLDLPAIDDAVISSIEVIDLRGSGANKLVLNLAEVANLSKTLTEGLSLIADAGDTVTIGAGWSLTGTQISRGRFFRILEQAGTRLLMNGPADLQNPVLHLDVNNDGIVAPVDALIIINEKQNHRFTDDRGRVRDPVVLAADNNPGNDFDGFYRDVDGDGFIVPLDALLIFNHLNRIGLTAAEGEGAGGLGPIDSFATSRWAGDSPPDSWLRGEVLRDLFADAEPEQVRQSVATESSHAMASTTATDLRATPRRVATELQLLDEAIREFFEDWPEPS